MSSHAADFRTRLGLLLGENVLLVAKMATAAENHSDEYASYATLMSASAHDLASLVGKAFGNTAASEFAQLWGDQAAGFVDYTIGVVTHDSDKSRAAMLSVGTTEPQIGQFFATLLHSSNSLVEPFNGQVAPIKLFIDDGFAQNYGLMYREIDIAFTQAVAIGDSLAQLIVAQFPDKFPGDISSKSVERRALVNDRLLERAYLETMLTDALATGRAGDAARAAGAVGATIDALAPSPAVKHAWQTRLAALQEYASGGTPAAGKTLMLDFAQQLASSVGAPPNLIADQATATLQAVDDQRAKNYTGLPQDDRSAATAMQPLADALADNWLRLVQG